MNNQSLAEKVAQLEAKLQELGELATLKQVVQEQQTEIASLREALTHKTASTTVPTITNSISSEPTLIRKPDTTRRKMLKRMGLAVLAGGAALGITAVTYAPAEAKLSVNPSSNVGAVITRIGASITNIPTDTNYGLVVSADGGILDSTGILFSGFSTGVTGLADADEFSIGVYGYSTYGTGVFSSSISGTGLSSSSKNGNGIYSISTNGIGIYGASGAGIGIRGETNTATQPAINAKNNASTKAGIALQIEQGGFTIKGAGISSTTSSTAAFIHQTTADNIGGNTSKIDNPLCNNRQNALLFVTHNWNPPGVSSAQYLTMPLGVYYNSVYNQWTIYTEDQSPMPADAYFNVLIINP